MKTVTNLSLLMGCQCGARNWVADTSGIEVMPSRLNQDTEGFIVVKNVARGPNTSSRAMASTSVNLS